MSGQDLSSYSDRELDEILKTLCFSANYVGIMEIMKEKERRIRLEAKKETNFMSGISVALKEKIHTDIQLKPGKDNGNCIPAHKSILASRSQVFKNMLECEPTPDQTITLPEVNSEELKTLLEFLYSGSLPLDKLKNHLCPLFHSAHKYEIPYLQELCERYILDILSTKSVLNAMEISDRFSSLAIKDAALKLLVENMEEVTSSPGYDAFAARNPHLAVQITRAYVNHAKVHVPKEVKRRRISYHNPYDEKRYHYYEQR